MEMNENMKLPIEAQADLVMIFAREVRRRLITVMGDNEFDRSSKYRLGKRDSDEVVAMP